ncbi:PLP-dependent aminotransferase family protein [Bordetella genomosp. 2]|uniref:DNA-binding protein n=1 Tax=Bordetella genomosp. 2 TaxID=1983456 RepID=A0A261VXB4_9BORD|nr:PLP-dependent aminotransferase family protein [Bordetella genomosp. 2]OZI78421.1 DNA-binding protein [Bordetella genomosp. 2]
MLKSTKIQLFFGAMNDGAALLDSPLATPRGRQTLQRQLLQRLKQSILDGRLPPGSRLPASRALADQLGVSRNTVLLAYGQLTAEGYVLADRQGTRVAPLPSAPRARPPQGAPSAPTARRIARIPASAPPAEPGVALRPGTPALSHFPLGAWRRAVDRALRNMPLATLGYGDPAGEPALRQAIARHLGISRGVRCAADQIVITEGAQEALSLCARLVGNPGDTAWVEDPGYRGAKTALQASDLRIVPVPVDEQGIAPADSLWRRRPPRLIYATPSHQYPTGAVLAAARRLALLERARQAGAWIIEDDYDSEFRHHGEPIPAMQGLAEDTPVLYAGTFSKTMFPALRIGFLVVPPALDGPSRIAVQELLRGGHRHEQLALAEFIDSGQFARHLGRMRRLYRDRQQALRAALARYLALPHQLVGGQGGLHLTLRLPARYPDQAIAAEARRAGMAPAALSGFALRPAGHNGLVLGYGNTPAELFEPLIKRLAAIIEACAGR